MLASSASASGSAKLPMVEPGKKPSRGRPSICGGSAMACEKSARTGSTRKSGKRAAMRACAPASAASEISIGT